MTPLPSTATTMRQTAKRGPRPPKPTTDSVGRTITPIIKAGHTKDPPRGEISLELLTHFRKLGMTRQEILNVAAAWLITETEIAQWIQKVDAAQLEERNNIEIEIAKLANQMEACLLAKGQVKTLAIRIATPDRILEWIDYYETELTTLYPLLDDTEHEDHTQHVNDWKRYNAYLWECKSQAGLTPLTYTLTTGMNLNEALNNALDQMEATT